MGGSNCANPFNRRQRVNRSAAAVMGIFQTDQCRLNRMRVFGTDCRFNLLGRDEALAEEQ